MADLKRFHDAVLNNNVDVAKTLIDNGLDPNGILEECSCPNSCDGYTLLYMACVHDRMAIVSILLQAEADPDGCNRKEYEMYIRDMGLHTVHDCMVTIRTSFTYVIKQRNLELMRVLLRENKVHVGVHASHGSVFDCCRLLYGQFRHFLEDEDVMKVLIDVQLPCYYEARDPEFGSDICKLLQGSAVHRCSKLCKFLMDQYGIGKAVNAVLAYGHGTDTMSYMVDVYGAKNFVEGNLVKDLIMAKGTRGMLELLMDHLYQVYGDNKALWKEQMVDRWTWRGAKSLSMMHSAIKLIVSYRFICLLRWGVYSVLPDFKHKDSVLYELALNWEIESTSVFISLYPQCLQELCWMGSEPWTRDETDVEEQEVEEYYATLVEKRKHAPSLQKLCRSVVFHALGINPIPKAERLPLPRILKDFIQCKELFETTD